MSLSPQALRLRLVDLASQPYRVAGGFAYHFARGKLGGDPMFLDFLAHGLIPDGARILDLGCGQGLLAAWLLAARQVYRAGEWPSGWPVPGQPSDIRGIDLRHSDIRRARVALGAPAHFEQGDMRQMDFGRADVVVIMDALHYIDIPSQDDVLRRVRASLPANGLLVTRVGDAGTSLRSKFSNWVDRSVLFFRGNARPSLHCRPLQDWIRTLESLGFSVATAGMNSNRFFGNVVLLARPTK